MTTGSDLETDVLKFHQFFQNIAKLVPTARKQNLFNGEDSSDEGLGSDNTRRRAAPKTNDLKRKAAAPTVANKKQKVNLQKNRHKNAVSNTSETEVVVNGNQASAKPKTQVNGIETDGKIVFSKFDFGASGEPKEKRKKEKKRKKLELCIKKATTMQEKLENIKSVDPEKAEKMVEKDTWVKAISRAKGEKVRDNVNLLNKSIKRLDEKKKKSAKKWKERNEKVEEQQKKRQNKRMENIKKKKFSKGKFKHRRVQGF